MRQHRIISKDAASRIWLAHREVEVGEQLLAEIEKELAEHGHTTPMERHYGISRRIEMGIPGAAGVQRLVAVAPYLALSVIRAHIADKKQELIVVSEEAIAGMPTGPHEGTAP